MSELWERVPLGTQLIDVCKNNLFLSEETIIERYKLEKQMIRLVADGDYINARKLIDSMTYHEGALNDFVARTRSEEERLRNHGIVMNSALRIMLLNTNVPFTIIHGMATYFGQFINFAPLEYLQTSELFDRMLKAYCSVAKEFGSKPYSPAVEKIVEYIVTNLPNKLGLQQLSDKFSYSSVHINRLLKAETGYSAIQFIKRKRISLAKVLIDFDNIPMEEIAAMVGYPDYNYFCRVFRQVENVSPSKYLGMSRDRQ